MSKVYGYCRTAFACDEEIAEQMELIRAYCNQHGLVIEKYFYDNGGSGLDSYRVELSDLLYTIQKGDIIVVKNISRLFRDMCQCMSFMELIDSIGVTLHTIY